MKKSIIKPIISLALLGLASQANAGGLYLYEIGTEDLGLAGAGTAARAQDASVIAGNPAGMTRLDGNQLVMGGQVLYGDFHYELNNPTLEGPGNVVGWLPGASAFYSHSISDDLKMGIAMYGNFGLSLDFGNEWAGRYLVKESTLMGLTLQPTVGYRLNNAWSVGAGVGINCGIFSLTRDRLFAGDEHTEDDTDIAPNAHLGILFEPSKETRFGLTWTSEVDYEFDIDASGSLPLANSSWMLPLDASVGAPQQAMVSAVQALDSKWSLLANIGWQDWSSFSENEVTLRGLTVASKLELQDTLHGAVGTQYQMNTETRLNFGVAYDTSMYDDQNTTSFTMPTGAAWRFGTGVQQQLNEKASLGVAFEYVLSEDAHVTEPAVLAGSYNNMQMYFVAVNYSYRF
jgi:long-chain fatty acid transport protein